MRVNGMAFNGMAVNGPVVSGPVINRVAAVRRFTSGVTPGRGVP